MLTLLVASLCLAVALAAPVPELDVRSDGSYDFRYATGPDAGGLYREESRSTDGVVHGRYSYIDPTGVIRTVHYRADADGFHVMEETGNPSQPRHPEGPAHRPEQPDHRPEVPSHHPEEPPHHPGGHDEEDDYPEIDTRDKIQGKDRLKNTGSRDSTHQLNSEGEIRPILTKDHDPENPFSTWTGTFRRRLGDAVETEDVPEEVPAHDPEEGKGGGPEEEGKDYPRPSSPRSPEPPVFYNPNTPSAPRGPSMPGYPPQNPRMPGGPPFNFGGNGPNFGGGAGPNFGGGAGPNFGGGAGPNFGDGYGPQHPGSHGYPYPGGHPQYPIGPRYPGVPQYPPTQHHPGQNPGGFHYSFSY